MRTREEIEINIKCLRAHRRGNDDIKSFIHEETNYLILEMLLDIREWHEIKDRTAAVRHNELMKK